MGRVYSAELWHLEAVGVGPYISEFVPDGYLWILRDVSVVLTEGPGTGQPPSFIFYTHAYANAWFTRPDFSTMLGLSYQWSGRKVLNTGDAIEFDTNSIASNVAVSGYVLSLP
jgi:hypothetical protein